jgi:mRNA interferase YafQ
MIDIIWDSGFRTSYRKRIRQNDRLRSEFRQTVVAFAENPFNPILNTHRLTGRLAGLWVFSVDDDCRVLFAFINEGNAALLMDSGSHSEVY